MKHLLIALIATTQLLSTQALARTAPKATSAKASKAHPAPTPAASPSTVVCTSEPEFCPGGIYDQNTEAGKVAYTLHLIDVYKSQGNYEQALTVEMGLPLAYQSVTALQANIELYTQKIIEWEKAWADALASLAVCSTMACSTDAERINNAYGPSIEQFKKYLADFQAELARRGV